MVRLIGFCLLAAVMTMLLRQMNPGMAARFAWRSAR